MMVVDGGMRVVEGWHEKGVEPREQKQGQMGIDGSVTARNPGTEIQ